jgi:tight adherence protein C
MSNDDIYLAAAGVVALLCIWGISRAFGKRGKMAVRIKAIQERRQVLSNEALAAKKRRKPELSINFMREAVTRLRLLKNSQAKSNETLLIEGGFRSKDAIYILAFFNTVMPVVLAVAGFIVMGFVHFGPKWHLFNYAWPLLGAYIGLKLGGWYVGFRRRRRYYNIQKALPDVLDLMTICAEAGLSLGAMLERVARELGIAYPEMAEELALTAVEMGFLPDRNKALSNLADRCLLPEVRGITSVLIQTEKYGTPIAQALRVLSSEFRQARMLRAEQKAARLPALMTVPMIVCVLPTLFIVIIAPAIVKLMDTVSH